MSKKTSNTGNGIGFGGALFLIFIVLKLCRVIEWSWWWVTAPLWMPIALILGIIVVVEVVRTSKGGGA